MVNIGFIECQQKQEFENVLKEVCSIANPAGNSNFRLCTLVDTNKLDPDVDIQIMILPNAKNISDDLFTKTNQDTIMISNADDRNILRNLKGIRTKLITCGYNKKASVTASSVQDTQDLKSIQYCVQRSFASLSGLVIEAQEFPVTFSNYSGDILIPLFAITTALVMDFSF